MAEMRLVVAGAGGRMGRTLVKAIADSKDFALAGALEDSRSPLIGWDSGTLAGLPENDIKLAGDAGPLLAKANGIIDLYRWLPWVSRKIAFDRPNHGDPFETPTSRSVRVKITTSRKLVLATSGDRTAVSADGLTQTFAATDVRDFNITAAIDYRTRSRVVRDSIVRVYYRPGAPGAAMLDAAADAFDALERRLGSYPHRTFRVAQSAGAYGMESPGLIWIPTGVGAANLRYLAAHETAHQWFYGIVGNDQARQPFADEAAADFVARFILALKRASRCSTDTLYLSISQYTETCYYETIYIQGGNLLDRARRAMGSTAFWPLIVRPLLMPANHQP